MKHSDCRYPTQRRNDYHKIFQGTYRWPSSDSMHDLIGKFLSRGFFEHPILVVDASRSGTA